jgi:hypothetical protein
MKDEPSEFNHKTASTNWAIEILELVDIGQLINIVFNRLPGVGIVFDSLVHNMVEEKMKRKREREHTPGTEQHDQSLSNNTVLNSCDLKLYLHGDCMQRLGISYAHSVGRVVKSI